MKKVLAEAVASAVRKAIEAGKLPQGEMAPVVLVCGLFGYLSR